MVALITLMPANEEDYPKHPAIVLSLTKYQYHVDIINVDGGIDTTTKLPNLTASLAHVTCAVAQYGVDVEYVVEL